MFTSSFKLFTVFSSRAADVPIDEVVSSIAKLTTSRISEEEAGPHYIHPTLREHMVKMLYGDPIVGAGSVMRCFNRRQILGSISILIFAYCFISIVAKISTNTDIEISFERIVLPGAMPTEIALLVLTWLLNCKLNDLRESPETHDLVRKFDKWAAEASTRLRTTREELFVNSKDALTRLINARLVALADDAIKTRSNEACEQLEATFIFFQEDFELPWKTPEELIVLRKKIHKRRARKNGQK